MKFAKYNLPFPLKIALLENSELHVYFVLYFYWTALL